MSGNRLLKQYHINKNTFLLKGNIVNKKLTTTIVYEKDAIFEVDRKLNSVISTACKNINSTITNAKHISREIFHESRKKLPLVVGNDFGQPLILFPLFSPRCKDNTWVLYNAVTNIVNHKTHITVTFQHQYEIDLDVSIQIFNNRYVDASILQRYILKNWNAVRPY